MSGAPWIRLAVLATGAFASMATSEVFRGSYADQVSPFHGQTAVPADVQPSVVLSLDGDADPVTPDDLELFTLAGTPVAGDVQVTQQASNAFLLRFVPAAPLPPGDYRLLVHASDSLDEGLIDGDTYSEHVAEFSTLSRPTIRAAALISPGLLFELSQAVDPDSLLAHVSAIDATGDPLPLGELTRVDDRRFAYTIVLPVGAVMVDIADGVLAADGTPVPGLPLHLEAY